MVFCLRELPARGVGLTPGRRATGSRSLARDSPPSQATLCASRCGPHRKKSRQFLLRAAADSGHAEDPRSSQSAAKHSASRFSKGRRHLCGAILLVPCPTAASCLQRFHGIGSNRSFLRSRQPRACDTVRAAVARAPGARPDGRNAWSTDLALQNRLDVRPGDLVRGVREPGRDPDRQSARSSPRPDTERAHGRRAERPSPRISSAATTSCRRTRTIPTPPSRSCTLLRSQRAYPRTRSSRWPSSRSCGPKKPGSRGSTRRRSSTPMRSSSRRTSVLRSTSSIRVSASAPTSTTARSPWPSSGRRRARWL